MTNRIIELGLRIKVLSERLDELEKAKDSAEGFKDAVAGLRNQLLALGSALVGLDKLKEFVETGIETNKELENTRLGIAGIVASQAELRDSQGRVIEGQKAFAAATAISGDQLQKLKIDSLQTTATFGQLRDAFQAAISPGLEAGLDLDQIRTLTKEIALTAGALGLDTSQIAQEVGAILSGEIDINAAIARNLGITNDMVQRWKEQGTLAQELSERMRGFAQMGDAASKSWAGITSNLSEAYQTLAGFATAGFYEQIKAKLDEALSGIFNLETGQLEGELQGVSDLLNGILTDVGEVLGDTIVGLADGLKSVSGYLQDNKDEADAVRQNFGLVFDQVKEIGARLVSIVSSLASAGAEGQVLSATFEVIAKTVAAFRDGVDFIVMGFTKLGSVVLTALAAPIEQAGKALSLFGIQTGELLDSLSRKMKEQAQSASESAGRMWQNFAEGRTHLAALNQEAEKFRTLVDIPQSQGFGAVRDQIQQLATGMKDAKKPIEETKAEAARLQSQVETMFSAGQISRDEYIVAMGKIKASTGDADKAIVSKKTNLEKYYQDLGKIVGASGKFVAAQGAAIAATAAEIGAAIELAKAKGDERKVRELTVEQIQTEIEAVENLRLQHSGNIAELEIARRAIIETAGGHEKLTAAQRLEVAQIDQLIAGKKKDIAASGEQIQYLERSKKQAEALARGLGALIAAYRDEANENQRSAAVAQARHEARINEIDAAIRAAEAKGDEAEVESLLAKRMQARIDQADEMAGLRAREAQDAENAVSAKTLELAADGELSRSDQEQIKNLEALAQAKKYAAKQAADNADALRVEATASEKSATILESAGQRIARMNKEAAAAEKNRSAQLAAQGTWVSSILSGWQRRLGALSEAARLAFDATIDGSKRSAIGVDAITAAIARNEDQMRVAMRGMNDYGFVKWANTVAYQALSVERAFLGQAQAVQRLTDGLKAAGEGGTDSARKLESFIRQAEASQGQFNLLDRSKLDNLQREIDSAKDKLRQLQDEARSARETLADMAAELLAAKGDTAAADRLRLQNEEAQKRRDIEDKLAQAQAASNQELIALYREQLATLGKIYSQKQKNLEQDIRAKAIEPKTPAASASPSPSGSRTSAPSGGVTNVTNNFYVDPLKMQSEEFVRQKVIPVIEKVTRLRR